VNAVRELATPTALLRRLSSMSSKSKSTARPARPSTEDHDDTVEAHYSGLERPHACIEGFVYVGHLVEDEHGDEVEVIEAVPCSRCADGEAR
jgi:hypothetical protein